jgi:hypothetical protein
VRNEHKRFVHPHRSVGSEALVFIQHKLVVDQRRSEGRVALVLIQHKVC